MATHDAKTLARQPYFDLDGLTQRVIVTYLAGPKMDKAVTVQASFVDICNQPNVRGTVVSLSGSPGSHNDVKYMKEFFEKENIRLVCTNWPGSEFVTGGLTDSYTNPERNSYMKALMEKLDLKKVEKLVIMGFSRSGENALQLADMLSEDPSWPLVGVMALNSPGFVIHKGLKSRLAVVNFFAFFIKLHSRLVNFLLFPVLDWFYNDVIGVRVADGKVSAAAILPMQTFAFGEQKVSIDSLKRKPWIRTFYGYGGKDFLIDEEDSEEIAKYFKGNHFKVQSHEMANEIKQNIMKAYERGQQAVTVNFTEEGHFLQKTYPEFLVQVIGGMFDIEVV